MKKIILLGTALLFVALSSFGQKLNKSQVPSVILNKFQKAYPTANDIEWKQKAANYEVEFEIGQRSEDHEILYDATGKEIRHKEELRKSQCPAAITQSLTKLYPGYVLKDIDKITTPATTYYKVKIKTANGKQKMYFNEAGQKIANPKGERN